VALGEDDIFAAEPQFVGLTLGLVVGRSLKDVIDSKILTEASGDLVLQVGMAVVFKYRDANARALDILRDRGLWLAAPSTFTDPSDMRIPIKGLFNASPEAAFQRMVRNSLEQDPGQRVADVLNDTSIAMTEGGLHRKLMNGLGAQILNEVREEAGVISFGKTADNSHLWEKYANEECGLCYGFETGVLGYKAHPVTYVKVGEEPALSYFEASHSALREAACLLKYVEYLPEDEVRIILPRKAGTYLKFARTALVSVTFGARCKASFKLRVRKILSCQYPNAVCAER
jgi:hypothetical protein